MNPDSAARKKPQRLKEKLKEVASAAILEAAEEVFLKQGLQAPMELIAARAGVAVGTLYNHFSDRRTLVDALLTAHREKLKADVQAAEAATMHLPVREQLIAMLNSMTRSWSRIFLVIKQGEQIPDGKKRAEIRTRIGTLFGPVLERGRKQGVIAADPDRVQAIALHGLIHALFALAADDPKWLPPERVGEVLVDTFLHGAAKRGKA
jgi:AcrR family transcriptional regulator